MTAQSIPPHELASWINTQTAVDLIDVRSPAEFEESHLTAARNVPLAGLSASDLPNDDRPVVFVCRSGQRSGQACAKFVERRVFSVAGGTQACIDVGMSAVSGKRTMALDRQVRIAAGSLVLLGFALSFLNPWMLGISVFVGAGLVFSGVTDTCTMGMLLAKMPWNQVTRQSHPSNMVAMLICSGALSAGNTLSAVESLDVKVCA